MGTIRELFRAVGNLFRWWFIVAPWEQAIRVRRGKKADILDAGMHLRIPVIDRVFRQSTRRRFTSVPTQTITTADEKTVTVSGVLGYTIEDIGLLYHTLHQAEGAIQCEAQGLVGRFMAQRCLTECLPAAVEAYVTGALDLAQYGLGHMEYFVTDFAAVRTYRLIQGEPRNWIDGGDVLTTNHDDTAY